LSVAEHEAPRIVDREHADHAALVEQLKRPDAATSMRSNA
jgi:hypothetical protein